MDSDIFNIYEDYVPTSVEGITRGVSLQDAYIVVLRSQDGQRHFPLLVDKDGFSQVLAAVKKKDYACSHLMLQLAERTGLSMTGVRVMQPHNGKYLALIDFSDKVEVKSFSAALSDAIVAALEANAPIYIPSKSFKMQQPSNAPANSMALPVTAMNDQLLKEAMQGAVKADNFELAKVLRDELQKRKYSISKDILAESNPNNTPKEPAAGTEPQAPESTSTPSQS